jgi:cysteine-rich repeat protein
MAGATTADAGAGGEPPTGTSLGAPCDEEKELICPGPISESVLVCTDGVWELSEACPRGKFCDSNDPSCKSIAPGCERLGPGDSFCDGSSRFVCGPDLVTLDEEECEGRCTGGECVDAQCGDGSLQADEECDDGNEIDTDDCPSTCLEASCGDGYLFSRQEDCDDGNNIDTDDCPSTCRSPQCGDGFTWEGTEECDDGNSKDSDGCLQNCLRASCGDGEVFTGTEECDDANEDDTDDCPGNCGDARCGDGYVWKGKEECDQGDEDPGDGCSSDCQAEPFILALGSDHSCALLGDGRLKCWGANADSQSGPSTDLVIGDSPLDMGPNLPALLTGVTSVATGASHTCAVQSEVVTCWGNNDSSQLGPMATGDSPEPITVPVNKGMSVCVSNDSSYALLSDKTVQGWGYNHGQGSRGIHAVPFSEKVQSIACGANSICAVLQSGNVECWGIGLTSSRPAPMRIALKDRTGVATTQVVHGGDHACARQANGEVYCWGRGETGALGEGSPDDRPGDIPLSTSWPPLPVGFEVRDLTAGGGVTCAAGQGKAKCWGLGIDALGAPELVAQAGNLGDEPEDAVQHIPLIDVGDSETVRTIATGDGHTCAILASGKLKCWGLNASGELGIGNVVLSISQMGNQLQYTTID